jgi:hypothetical protein
MAGGFLGWVGSLWIGFALIYLPFIDRFSYSETVPFGSKGIAEALYVSAVSLTTVGFGDVVASSDALRLVTVAESASGLAAITAAITYLLSVYPLVTRQRGAALHASDLGLIEPAQVVRVAMQGGPTVVADLQQALIEAHQNVTRFPVLYYFHPDQPEESMNRLLRAGIMVCLVPRWERSPSSGSARVLGAPPRASHGDVCPRRAGPSRASVLARPHRVDGRPITAGARLGIGPAGGGDGESPQRPEPRPA